MNDPLTLLIISFLSFAVGAIANHFYSRTVATDKDEAMEEASQLIADLLADNERLEAELAELRRGVAALGGIDWGKVGE